MPRFYIDFLCACVCAYQIREKAVGEAITDLVTKVDPAAFQQAFGAGIGELQQLVAAKTVTKMGAVKAEPARRP